MRYILLSGLLLLWCGRLAGQITADFTYNYPVSLCAPQSISFINTSTTTPNNPLTYAWYVNGGTPLSTSNNFSYTFLGDTTFGQTNYTVRLTVTDTANITSQKQVVISVKNNPIATLTDAEYGFKPCEFGDNVKLKVTNSNFANSATHVVDWGDGSSILNTNNFGNSQIHTYPYGIFNINYTVTNPNGCSASNSYTVGNINNPAIGASSPGNTKGCGDKSITFSIVNYISNDSSTTYDVDFGDGSPIVTYNHPPPDSLAYIYTTTSCTAPNQQFVFSVDATNICASSGATVYPIEIYTAPQASFIPLVTEACVSTTVDFDNTSIEGYKVGCSDYTEYLWIFGDGDTSAILSSKGIETHTYLNSGTYTVTLLAWNTCDTSFYYDTITIIDPPTATPTFQLNNQNVTEACTPTDLSVIANVVGQSTTITWTLIYPNNTTTTANTDAHTFPNLTQAGTYTIALNVRNICTTEYDWQDTFILKTTPTVSPVGIAQPCDSVTLDPSAMFNIGDGGGTITGYQWSFTPDGTPANFTGQNPPNVTFPTPGNKTVTLSVTNECGTTTRNNNFMIDEAPIPLAVTTTGTSTACLSNNSVDVSYTNQSSLATSYSWSVTPIFPNSSNIIFTNGTSSSTPNPTIRFFGVGQYEVSLTAINTCSSTVFLDTIQIIESPTVSPLTPPGTACDSFLVTDPSSYFNVYDGQGNLNYSWTFVGGTPSTSTAAMPSNVMFNNIGINQIILQVTNECSSATDTVAFEIKNIPGQVNAGPDLVLCEDAQSVNLSTAASPANGSWSGNGVNQNTGVFTPNAAMAGFNITITYNVTNSVCIQSDNLTIQVNPLPTVEAGTNVNICEDAGTHVFTGFTPNNGQWYGDGIAADSSGIFYIDSVNGTGNYTSFLTYTDPSTGCKNTDNVTVTVNPLPTVSTVDTLLFCDTPNDINLNDPSLTGLSPFGGTGTGTWSGPGVNTTNGTFNTNTAGGPNVYTLVYTYENNFFCQDTSQIRVRVIEGDTAQAGIDIDLCANQGIQTLQGFSPNGGTWSGNNGFNFINTQTGTFTANQIPGIYTLTYTIGAGTCQTTDQIIVTISDTIVNAGNPLVTCVSDTVLTLNNTGESPPGGTWSSADPTWITNNVFHPNRAGIGNRTLTYTYNNPSTGCSGTATKIVTINGLPNVQTIDSLEFCNSNTAIDLNDFNVTNLSPTSGTWTGLGVNSSTGIFNTINAGGAGQYLLNYTYTDDNSCVDSSQTFVNVVPTPVINAGQPTSWCINQGIQTLQGFSPLGGMWSSPDGFIFLDNNTGQFDANQTPNTYQLIYEYGAGTCYVTDTVDITIYGNAVFAGDQLSACESDTLLSLAGTNENPINGVWTGVGIIDSINGIFNPNSVGDGTHTVTYTYNNPNTGCSGTASKTIIVHPLPTVTTIDSIEFCNSNTTINLNDFSITQLSPTAGTWTGLGVNSSTGTFSTVNAGGAGQYLLNYTYSDLNSCVDSSQIIVDVVNGPVADAGNNIAWCVNDGVQSLQGLPVGGTWRSVGNNFTFSNVNTGTFNTSAQTPNTTYTLVYEYGNFTCYTIDTVLVTIHGNSVDAGATQMMCEGDTAVYLTGMSALGGTWSGLGIMDSVQGIFNPNLVGNGTHTVTYTFVYPGTGCVGSDTKTIVVNTLPQPVFAKDSISCENAPVSFTNSSMNALTFQWDFGDGNASTLVTPTHTYTDSGTYVITLIATNQNGCIDSTKQSIYITKPPTAIIAKDTTEGCAVLDVNFQSLSYGSDISWAWDFGDNTTSQLENPLTISYPQLPTDTGIYNITLAVTNYCGTDVATDFVRVYARPIVAFGTNVDDGCSPLPIEIVNVSTGNTLDYFWDFGNGNTSTDSIPTQQYYVTDSVPRVYPITLIATNDCGADTVSKNITVLPNPVTSFFYTDTTSGCEPLTVRFEDYSTNGTFITWDFGDGNTASERNISHTFDSAGTYLVQQFVNNGCGFDTSTITITVFPSPIVDFIHTPIVCQDVPITFDNLSLDLAGSIWDFGDGDSSYLTNGIHTYTQSGTYNVTLTGISNTNGCTASVSSQVTVNPLPNASFTATPINGCEPLEVAFTNNSSGNFHLWDFGDGNTSNLANPTHLFTADSTYVVRLTTTDLQGCSNDTMTTVIVNPSVTADFDFTIADTCGVPVFVSFQNLSSSNAVSFSWNFDNGNTSTNNAPTTVYNAAGQYTVSLIASSQFGCLDTITKTITIYDYPIVQLAPNTLQGCSPLAIDFNNTSTGTGHYWDFGNGVTFMTIHPNYAITDTGWHQVYYQTTDTISSCQSDTTLLVYVAEPAVAQFNVTIADTCGVPVDVSTTNQSIGSSIFAWDFDNGISATSQDTTVTYNNAGDYTIRLISDNPYQCPDTAYQSITIYDYPIVQLAPNTLQGCSPLAIDFNNTSTGTGHYWDFGNGVTFTTIHPNYAITDTGWHQVYYQTTDTISGCQSDTTLLVYVAEPAVAQFTVAIADTCGVPVDVSTTNQSIGSSIFTWDFDNGISATSQDTTVTYNNAGDYTIRLISDNPYQCPDTAYQSITIYDYPIVQLAPNRLEGCSPLAIDFNNTSTGTGHYWDFGNGVTFTTIYPNYVITDTGWHQVYYQTTDTISGCQSDTTLLVYVAEPAVAQFNVTIADTCGVPVDVSTTNQSIGSSIFAWDFDNGISATSQDTTVTYDNAGDYTIRLIADNPYQCPDTTYQSITIYDYPIVDVIPSTILGCTDLTVSFTNLSNGTGHLWNFDNGNISTLVNPSVTYTNAGNYNVHYISTDTISGCKSDTTITIEVGLPVVADFDIVPANPCGVPVNVSLFNTSNNADTYSWDLGNGTTSTTTAPLITYNNSGDYNISLIANNYYQCPDTITKTFRAYDIPIVDFELVPNQGCPPLRVDFVNTSQFTNNYTWTFGNGDVSTQEDPDPIIYENTDPYNQAYYTVTLEANSDSICFGDATKIVGVYPQPIADFKYEDLGGGRIQFLNLSEGATTYKWDFGDGNQSFLEDTIHRYYINDTRIITLEVENLFECKDTIVQEITPEFFGGLFVPNAFSPLSGTERVRLFKPDGVGLATYHVWVYTKWGELVWESEALQDGRPAEAWDGLHFGTGKLMPQASYVWKISATFEDGRVWEGQTNTRTGQLRTEGTVTLLR